MCCGCRIDAAKIGPGSGGSLHILREQVLKVDSSLLEPDRVDVRDIVANYIHPNLMVL